MFGTLTVSWHSKPYVLSSIGVVDGVVERVVDVVAASVDVRYVEFGNVCATTVSVHGFKIIGGFVV